MNDNGKSVFVSILVSLVLTLVVIWTVWGQGPPTVAASVSRPAANGAELHVCATCTCTTVQAAVDAASAGDVNQGGRRCLHRRARRGLASPR